MNRYLQRLADSLIAGTLLSRDHFVGLDADEIHNSRYCSEFEEEWLRVSSELDELHENAPVSSDDSTCTARILEFSFKKAYEFTQDSDISGLVSDDFSLFCKALVANYHDPWLTGLFECYGAGKFPHRDVSSVQATIESLL